MLGKILNDLYKYHDSISWIAHDLFVHFRREFLFANLIAVTSPTLQATAFALLTSFAVASAKGTPIQARYLQLGFLEPNDLSTVLTVSLLCAVLLSGSALTRYFSEKLFINLRFNYTRFSIARGIDAIVRRWTETDDEASSLRCRLILLVRRDSISCGRIAASLASIGAPLVEFVLFGSVAIYLHPWLSCVIATGALFSAKFFRRVVSQGNFYSSAREKQSTYSSNELREYVATDFSDNKTHGLEIYKDFQTRLPSTEEWIYSLSEYILVVPKSRFVATILTGFIVSIIVIFLGEYIASDASRLNQSLLFIIMLRYVLRSFQQITSRFSSLNRFCSQARRYQNLLNGKLPSDFYENSDLEEEEF